MKKALAGGDQAKYHALLKGTDLPKTMILPKEIDGCQREDNNKIALQTFRGRGGRALVQKVGVNQWRATDRKDSSRSAIGSDKQGALRNLNTKYNENYTEC